MRCMLIGTYNSMLCPNHLFRPEPTKISQYVIDAVKMFEETREMARVVCWTWA